MTLARTALRFAAIAALNADPVIAALCGPRVYDSRIDELDAKDPVPVIVVFTEDDRGSAFSANNGGPPFDHTCDLLLEISMRVLVPVTDTDAIVIGTPETDAEAEATLDLLEWRAIEAVTNADTAQAMLIRTSVVRRATELKSIRFASADSGSKLALRMVTLTTHLLGYQPDPTTAAVGPFASLPDPLATVAASLPVGSAAFLTCEALAAKLTANVPALFDGIDVTLQMGPLAAGVAPVPGDPNASDPILESIDLPCPPTTPSASS